MKRTAMKQCAFSLMQDARKATTPGMAQAFWVSARRVMTFGGYSPTEIDAECGGRSPAPQTTTTTEQGRPYAD